MAYGRRRKSRWDGALVFYQTPAPFDGECTLCGYVGPIFAYTCPDCSARVFPKPTESQ